MRTRITVLVAIAILLTAAAMPSTFVENLPRLSINVSAEGPDDPQIEFSSINVSSGGDSRKNSWIAVNSTSYNFTIQATHPGGFENITHINISAWYDWGNESTYYNETKGANANLLLSFNNTGKSFEMLFPKSGEVAFYGGSVYQKNSTTSIVNFTFRPDCQFYGANGSGNSGARDDLFSWNYMMNVSDNDTTVNSTGEFGVMFQTSIYVSDVTPYVDSIIPGDTDTTNIFTIRESSNRPYYLNITVSGNMTHTAYNFSYINVSNIYLHGALFTGRDNAGNLFHNVTSAKNTVFLWNNLTKCLKDTDPQYNGTFQFVDDVLFKVFIPIGTQGGTYNTYVKFKINQK